jgi:hypothetical protein
MVRAPNRVLQAEEIQTPTSNNHLATLNEDEMLIRGRIHRIMKDLKTEMK